MIQQRFNNTYLFIVSPYFFRLFIPNQYRAIALFPFVVLRSRELLEDKILLNHERIHIYQQLELLVLPFYLVYLFEFVYNILKYRIWSKAYMAISFEKEAFKHEGNLSYLKARKIFAMWR